MSAVLQLIPKFGHAQPRSRPFMTHYYVSAHDKTDQWARTGRASSPLGALRAAVVKVMLGRFETADIYGEDGYRLFHVMRKDDTLKIIGLFSLHTFE